MTARDTTDLRKKMNPELAPRTAIVLDSVHYIMATRHQSTPMSHKDLMALFWRAGDLTEKTNENLIGALVRVGALIKHGRWTRTSDSRAYTFGYAWQKLRPPSLSRKS